jgi:hypothetical protein
LEVFSNSPGVFTDQHLKTLQQLADWVGTATNRPSESPIGGPNSPAPLAGSSSQIHDWNDVLIDSPIPWKRFIASVFLHIVVVGMLTGVSRIWPRELILPLPSIREAHIIYYPLSQSFRAQESSPLAVLHAAPRRLRKHRLVATVNRRGFRRSRY